MVHCLYLFFLLSTHFSVCTGTSSLLTSTFVNMFLREKGEWKGRGTRERQTERERERRRERKREEEVFGERGEKERMKEEAGGRNEGRKGGKKRRKGGRRFDKETCVTIILLTSKNVENP